MSMGGPIRIYIRRLFALSGEWVAPNWRAFSERRDFAVWTLATFIGLIVAAAAILFRLANGAIQWLWLGTSDETILSALAATPWWIIIAAPMIAGLAVGILLHRFMPGRRAMGIADVIEARALHECHIPVRAGLTSALIAAISLGGGASAGREGPVVHLGATLTSYITALFSLPAHSRRTLFAAGTAAAVSASFNAPLAGILFAHEVILRHYALSAFVPIVLASVGAATLSRLWFGDFPAFIVPSYQITSYWEFPAFILLGITCAAVAIAMQVAILGSDRVARHIPIPLWCRPVIGGCIIGIMALFFPAIIGVGYDATDHALNRQLGLSTMLVLIVAKTAATAITLASRFGGGVFSPALYLGAMAGGAFGIIAAGVFPDLASSNGLYAILGMGAVAAAVLGAPISTTLIVFELTGGFAMSIALLLSASIACALSQLVHGGSFFYWQLGLRGLFLQEGPHKRIQKLIKVGTLYHPATEAEKQQFVLDKNRTWLLPGDSLETALRAFDDSGCSTIPVMDSANPEHYLGVINYVDALAAFNKALIESNVEEHR